MNIAVCIKQVPGTNNVEVDPITGVIKRNGIDSKMNPYDLYALETAMILKEQYGAEITVISMGPPQAKQIIKEAYSIGADKGVLLTDRKFAGADVLATSYTISQGISAVGSFDLILCGKQTTDGDTAQVGPEISEYLDIPCISNVTKIISADKTGLVVEMDLSDCSQKSKISFPCLISVEKDIYLPRLPSYLKKQETSDREIKVMTFADFKDQDEKKYGLSGSPTQVKRIFPPSSDKSHEIWSGSGEELSDKLTKKLLELKFIQRKEK